MLLQFKLTVFYINVFKKCNLFLWCKAEFSASLLQSSVSHDPSEIILKFWFAAQEALLIIKTEKNNNNAAKYFLDFFFFSVFVMNRM